MRHSRSTQRPDSDQSIDVQEESLIVRSEQNQESRPGVYQEFYSSSSSEDGFLFEPGDSTDEDDVFSGDDSWRKIEVDDTLTYNWDDASTYIRNPPYFSLDNSRQLEPVNQARILALLGDSITTDHISPAGAIAPDSPAGQYLMLGDNRDGSLDSRAIGLISRDRIVGRAHTVAFSVDYQDYYLPRLDRFIHPLSLDGD